MYEALSFLSTYKTGAHTFISTRAVEKEKNRVINQQSIARITAISEACTADRKQKKSEKQQNHEPAEQHELHADHRVYKAFSY